MELSPKREDVAASLRVFFGKENIGRQHAEELRVMASPKCQISTSPLKKQPALAKVTFITKKLPARSHQSPFKLKLVRVDSPTRSNDSGMDSPHFAGSAVTPLPKPSNPFYRRLQELITLDRELIYMKNVLTNRNSSIRDKQQRTLRQLEQLLPSKELEVSFEEFDPFLKRIDEEGNTLVPTATSFVAAYGRAEAAYDRLFQNTTQQELHNLYLSLDFNSKGHADLYDFAREAQLGIGGCIKPQHLYLTVRRLSSECKVTLSDLLAKASKCTGQLFMAAD